MKRSYYDLTEPQKDLLCYLAKCSQGAVPAGAKIKTADALVRLGFASNIGRVYRITTKGTSCLFDGDDEAGPRRDAGYPVRPIDRSYEVQAHHMAKAAHSLVRVLTKLDYAAYDLEHAARITARIHGLINYIDPLTPATAPEEIDPVVVYGRMDEAEREATPQDYIFAFESIATGTLMYAVTSTPKGVLGRKKVVQMRGPKIETFPVRRTDGRMVSVTVPGREA